MNSGDYIVVQVMTFPYSGIGHIAVIVEYDEKRGFKIKETDDENGRVDWIPVDHMTWFQCSATEEYFNYILYPRPDAAGNQVLDTNWSSIFDQTDREKVIQDLKKSYHRETGEELETDFAKRTGRRILDFGFVLKFKMTWQHTAEEDEDSDVTDWEFE